jgi:hypothetical protein
VYVAMLTIRVKSEPFPVSAPERKALAEEIKSWFFSDQP